MIQRSLLFASLIVLAVSTGCNRAPDMAPPEIRLGEQECDWCRMLISDERFAAALVVNEADAVRKLAFDDINCVFGYLADHPPSGKYKVYTHDFQNRTWLDAHAAIFVHSAKLETPMAAQLAAAPSRNAAQQLLERYPGDLLAYEDVARLFAKGPIATAPHGGDKP